MEIAADVGKIRAGSELQSVNEVEVELKDGDPAAALALAARIARDIDAGYGARSKAARGYALARHRAAGPVSPAKIMLPRKISVGDSFRAIALSCLRHVAANQDAVARVIRKAFTRSASVCAEFVRFCRCLKN